MRALRNVLLLAVLAATATGAAFAQGADGAVWGDTETGVGASVGHAPAAVTWMERKVLYASDLQTLDQFGFAVSVSGDVLAVGAPYEDGGSSNLADAGAVYLYRRGRDGTEAWGQVAVLRASDQSEGIGFGGAVSLSGETLVVGAPKKSDSGITWSGAVYVFTRTLAMPETWTESKILHASDMGAGDGFGFAVSLSVDTLVVGAVTKNFGFGQAYVFSRNQGGANAWGQVKILVPSDLQSGDRFGGAVSVSGDTAVVGAYQEDGGSAGGRSNAGAAYVFQQNQGGSNNWGEVKILHPSDMEAGDYFGIAVSLSGDTVAIGASREDGPGSLTSNAGATYIFERNRGGTNGWGEVLQIRASDMQAEDYFGYAVSLSGDLLAVGAYQEDGFYGDLSNSGAVYLFGRDVAGTEAWGEVQQFRASDAQATDNFGWAVSLSGTTLAVGAELEDGGAGDPATDAGAAYVILGLEETADADGDGVSNASDCSPFDVNLWSIPSEATGLGIYTGTSGLEWRWQVPASPGCTSVLYDLVRSDTASSFVGATCLPGEAGGTNTVALLDGDAPAPVYYYLVRSRNACGGNLGTGTGGLPRYAPDCY